MRLIKLTPYQKSKLIRQIQAHVAHNSGLEPGHISILIVPQPRRYPTELHYLDEDGVSCVEIGYKCDACGTIYSSYEEPGELCCCPKCYRPTSENY